MSTYSMDSLEKYPSNDAKLETKPETDFSLQLPNHNHKNLEKCNRKCSSGVANDLKKDKEFNKSSRIAMKTTRYTNNLKFRENSIIASKANVTGEFCSSVEELPVALGTKTNFRTGRSVKKKFNVPRRFSVSESSSSSLEFRGGCCSSVEKKEFDDIADSMKTDKKSHVVRQFAVVEKSKKPISYLQLYLKKFGVDRHQCIDTPKSDSVVSVGDDRQDERSVKCNDSGNSLVIPGEERCDVGFHRRRLHLQSGESRGSRSSEELDSFVKKEETGFNEGKEDNFSPGSLFDVVQPINRPIRVFYEPYNIEDYKSLSVPRGDRSLGPDKNEMETKGEWLMRRRTYGDSVSALNRQRILCRAEKLKKSRQTDSQKLAPYLDSMDLKHPGPASKAQIEAKSEREEHIMPVTNHCHSEGSLKIEKRKKADNLEKFPPIIRKKKSAPFASKRRSKSEDSSRIVSNLYETSNDTFDDESRYLKDLVKRHFEEKQTIDRLLKRGLCA